MGCLSHALTNEPLCMPCRQGGEGVLELSPPGLNRTHDSLSMRACSRSRRIIITTPCACRFAEEQGAGSADAAVDDIGNTLLHIAAASTSTTHAAVARLIAMGAGPNTANK